MTAIPISADMGQSLKRALADDMRESRFSRAELAEQLTAACGRTINESHLDAWAAETKAGHRMPAEMIGAWVQVTGSRRVIDLICGAIGLHAMDDTERDLAELGRVQLQQERLQQRLEAIKGDLWKRV